MTAYRHIISDDRADGIVFVAIVCPFCTENGSVIMVPEAGYDAWRGGALIQEALPDLTSIQRECLITGICPECWPEEEEPFAVTTESR